MIQTTFAYGAHGWGFAMVHDERGVFISTTEVRAERRYEKWLSTMHSIRILRPIVDVAH